MAARGQGTEMQQHRQSRNVPFVWGIPIGSKV